jgi:hypothetical protein
MHDAGGAWRESGLDFSIWHLYRFPDEKSIPQESILMIT